MHDELSAWRRWVHQPQNLWFRRAFFQIHLWIGIGIGLYVIAISLSGSAVVFGRELTAKFARKPVYVTVSGPRLSEPEMTQVVERSFPGYRVADIAFARQPNRAAMVALARGNKRTERLMDPYTGADLGDPLTLGGHMVQWTIDFHDNLFAGEKGRLANGIGAILVSLLSLTGAVLWWPGKKEWRRSLTVRWRSALPRLTWDLHSAIGFWCFLFVFLWGFSGIYFSFPEPFNAIAQFLSPDNPHSRKLSFGDQFLYWLAKLHFGRFGWQIEALWVVLGLTPVLMLITGALMWWYRSLRKIKMGREPTAVPHDRDTRRETPDRLAPALRRSGIGQ